MGLDDNWRPVEDSGNPHDPRFKAFLSTSGDDTAGDEERRLGTDGAAYTRTEFIDFTAPRRARPSDTRPRRTQEALPTGSAPNRRSVRADGRSRPALGRSQGGARRYRSRGGAASIAIPALIHGGVANIAIMRPRPAQGSVPSRPRRTSRPPRAGTTRPRMRCGGLASMEPPTRGRSSSTSTASRRARVA